jgi:hypothetical protein
LPRTRTGCPRNELTRKTGATHPQPRLSHRGTGFGPGVAWGTDAGDRPHLAVKNASTAAGRRVKAAQASGDHDRVTRTLQASPREKGPPMADLAYVLLVVGSFALLAATLRGLERL